MKEMKERHTLWDGVQRRFLPSCEIEKREGETTGAVTLEGHAAVFDTWTNIVFFEERFAPGSFSKSIQEAEVVALWNHNPDIVMGKRHVAGSGNTDTLELSQDETGLFTRIYPPKSAFREIESVERGDVNQMSIAFESVREENSVRKGLDGREILQRTITEARLIDVSPVTYPAYPTTDIETVLRCFPALAAGPFSRFKGVSLRASCGLELTAEDRDCLEAVFRDLQEMISPDTVAPIPEDHPTGDTVTPSVRAHLAAARIKACIGQPCFTHLRGIEL